MKVLLKASFLFLMLFFFVVFLISCSKNYNENELGATIRGNVSTSNGEAVEGATIYLNNVAKDLTASDGSFIVTGVVPGIYTLKAQIGSSTGSTKVKVDSIVQEITGISITIEQNTVSNGKIVGRVVDATTGQGINNVIVKIEELDLTTLTVSGSSAASDSTIQSVYGVNPPGDGYFVLSNVDIGTFKVIFSKESYYDNMKKVTLTSSNNEVDAGVIYLSYDVNSAGMIIGHVTDSSGNPVSNAKVTLDTGQTTTTNSNGDYKIENLPERIYDPTIPEQGYTLTVTSGTDTQTASKISVYSGKTTIVDVTLGVELSPPNLVMPADGELVSVDQPIFNWTGVGGADYYKVLVYHDVNTNEVIDNGTDEVVWMYETSDAIHTSVSYNEDEKGLPLLSGEAYIWTVKAANFSAVSENATPHSFTKN